MLFSVVFCAASAALALAHRDHDQKPISGPHKSLWYNTRGPIPGDGGTQGRNGTLSNTSLLTQSGRRCLLGHLNLWSSTLLALPRK